MAAASALLDSRHVDLVIVDLHLAGGSGLDLLPMLVDDRGVAIPAIIFSAHEVDAAAAAGVDAVLVKSRGSIPDLKATVRRILARPAGMQ